MNADHMRAAGAAAGYLAAETTKIKATLDDAHAAGLFIPQDAVEALRTLVALGAAWAANSQGQRAPGWVRAQLGLPAV